MSMTMTTTTLGTSSLRGSSSKTRNNPSRTTRHARTTLRQNSLISTAPSAQGALQPEPHGFYPAITHFTDAITALPRDFRRHTSLLKEVDAKAWFIEENIQKLLTQCLDERRTQPQDVATTTLAGSIASVAGDVPVGSVAGSVTGQIMDNASQISSASVDQDSLRRRRLYAELRQNLMQMIMPLDEKNHVINNANEELSRHIRRQDEIWPHIADEISEETRLGSLKHWALIDLNPTKKIQQAALRGREALVVDNEVAERSERRREAMALAKKQKAAQHADSDADGKKLSRKVTSSKKPAPVPIPQSWADQQREREMEAEIETEMMLMGQQRDYDRAQLQKATYANAGAIPMSRGNSQQDASKKRKAPVAATTVARKRLVWHTCFALKANSVYRINAATGESPKLGSSSLARSAPKEPYKRSPALAHVKPVNGRSRQNSTHSDVPNTKSASSRRNGITVGGADMERITSATGKTAHEVRHTMRETINTRGEKMLEENVPDSVENRIRGGVALERTGSKSSQLRREETVGRRTASPRLNASATFDNRSDRSGKGKVKPQTPIDTANESESAAEALSTAEMMGDLSKLKRPARPRLKDHHGLHDSLSPKGLPTKRAHKHKGSYSLSTSFSRQNTAEEPERKPSRTNSRKNDRERNASSTPKIDGELVDEPESMEDEPAPVRPTNSRRTSQNPRHKENGLDTKPPSRTAMASNVLNDVMSPALKDEPLGSPGPDIHDDEDADAEEEADDDDPNEQRYCYCNGVSYGHMVGCDGENCEREWFHLECIGLRALPPASSNWYCDECKSAFTRH